MEHEDTPQIGHNLLKLIGKTLNMPRTFLNVLLVLRE